MSAFNTPSSTVEIVSFLLLKKASVNNNIKCAEYDWAGDEEDSSDSCEGDSDDN
jgi:hypothetical protein